MTAYIKTLLRQEGRHVLAVFVLMVALGCLEGMGLLLLLPLLAMLGVTAAPEAHPSSVTTMILSMLQTFGMPLRLETVLGTYVVVMAGHAVLVRLHSLLTLTIQHRFSLHLRQQLYTALSQAHWLFVSRLKAAELTQMLTADVDRVGQGTTMLLRLASTVSMLVLYLGLAAHLSFTMTVLVLVCGALVLLAFGHQHARSSALGQTLSQARNTLYNVVIEHLGAMKVTKSYDAAPRHLTQFNAATHSLQAQFVQFGRTLATTKMVFDIGTALALSVLCYVALQLVQVPATDLLLLIYLCTRLLPQYSAGQQNYQHILHMLPAFTSVIALWQSCRDAAEPVQRCSVPPLALESAIVCQQLWFRYERAAEAFVLREVSCTIAVRQTTAIVGPSGAGKSTLADCLMGLLIPEQGTILVDGQPIHPVRSRAWRQRIGYVPQETFLFHDTVRANLLWAYPEASEAALRQALCLAAAEEFVARLPQGLDTVLGDRGVRLSGGERQRLALARALIRRPALLILDEATSALDMANEQRIHAALAALHGQLTIVLVAHRLSTIRTADRIIVLEAGQVVETGTWEALWSHPESRLRALARTEPQDSAET